MIIEEAGRSLAEKLQVAEKAIASTRGAFILFVLAKREAAPGKKGVQQMVDDLKKYLTPAEWTQLASITPLSPSMGYVQWIAQKYDVQHDAQEVNNAFWDSLFIPRGYVITASSSARTIQEPISA